MISTGQDLSLWYIARGKKFFYGGSKDKKVLSISLFFMTKYIHES